MDKQQVISSLEQAWKTGSRWNGVTRRTRRPTCYQEKNAPAAARSASSIPLAGNAARRALWQLSMMRLRRRAVRGHGNQAIQQVHGGASKRST